MKRTTRSSYRQDKYYDKVKAAVDQLLQDRSVLMPVEVFVQMGLLAQADYEAWRFGRIAYLERAIKCNLSKANRILRILRLVAEDRGLCPSRTVYKQWGKGEKIGLRFSKSGTPAVEELYATHYVARPEVDGG
jgi:hypothetical protein